MRTRAEIQKSLRLNNELAEAVLRSFIRDARETTGMEGMVLGLSGGVDSALSAALAARALGPERVHAFLLPYRTSNPDSARDATAVGEAFGLKLRTLDISASVDAYFDANENEADRVRRGNLMARIRMSILFDQAKKENCLVLGTSNKTEILLGYSTIFGDNASSINPLGDLYKQQVWQLAEHLGVPEQVVRKSPSADLWPGQTDEEELGFEYPVADEVLYLMFNKGYVAEEIVERGYDRDAVRKIHELEQRNRFKRRLMLIARLSGSAINLDREIPRD